MASEQEIIASQAAEIERLKAKVSGLEDQLYWLRKKMFGKMSEKDLPLDPTAIREPGLSGDALREKRQKEAYPIILRFENWMYETAGKTTGQSRVGRAINYTLPLMPPSERPSFTRCSTAARPRKWTRANGWRMSCSGSTGKKTTVSLSGNSCQTGGQSKSTSTN